MSQQQETFKPVDNNVPVLEGTTTESIASGTASDNSPTFNPPTLQEQEQKQEQQPKESKFVTQIKEVIVNISQDHYNKIVESLKKDQLRFEYVDGSGNIKVDLKQYVPMTIGQNKKVGKVLKRERLAREDISSFITHDEGALSLEEIKKKYSDIFDEDVDESDLRNDPTLNEIISNYSVAQKAKIYWGIESIENYTLNDLIMIIALYESRNGLGTPS